MTSSTEPFRMELRRAGARRAGSLWLVALLVLVTLTRVLDLVVVLVDQHITQLTCQAFLNLVVLVAVVMLNLLLTMSMRLSMKQAVAVVKVPD